MGSAFISTRYLRSIQQSLYQRAINEDVINGGSNNASRTIGDPTELASKAVRLEGLANEVPLRASGLRHVLGHEKEHLAIAFRHPAQEEAEGHQHLRIFARAAPKKIGFGFAMRKIRQLGRFLAVIEELVEWNL
jgi:hypothetical protein